MQDKYEIHKKQGKSWCRMLTSMGSDFVTYEEAEKEIFSGRYTWKDNEEVMIVRVSYHPVMVVTSKLSLETKKL